MADPDRIGKYEVRRRLGEGATSAVYLAFDPFANREVAVKLIFPEVLIPWAIRLCFQCKLCCSAKCCATRNPKLCLV